MNFAFLPDLLALAILIVILLLLRRRHPQGRADIWLLGLFFTLVEAVAHGHTHLLPCALHFVCNADGALQRVGDRLLGEDMQIVGQSGVHHPLMMCGRHDDGAEIRTMLVQGRVEIGIALIGAQAQAISGVLQRLRADIYRRHDFDQAVHARNADWLCGLSASPSGLHR